ncbi:MAG: 5-methyltetrahydropteroyltriglutamate--homocysteine S-methyltransferase [Chloroflexi bacterium]|nr:5-methyltetrahydropteroyltriglutamate--homocysteine S-methyltransferase [Chloroflexota bacterium]MBI3340670.1 5-methyltetrahydropteroyltriglutamate--homocysteine S-methyltransferase [Chloroflexota bacterium]
MAVTANLGYPRLGAKRELKWALEGYWSGKLGAVDLLKTGKELRLAHWRVQQEAGIDIIPSNDFSFYDQVLDTTCMVGAIPQRYSCLENPADLDLYFAMARGTQQGSLNLPAMEMTKWFDTNYHYLVPEIEKDQVFRFASAKVIDEFVEAKGLGIHTRPILLGPVSYLLLSKSSSPEGVPLDTLPSLISVYTEILQRLSAAGADWVQMDEPCLVLDPDENTRAAYSYAYSQLSQVTDVRLMVATYFGGLGENLSLAVHLPVAGLHIDLVRAPQQLENILTVLPAEKILSLGVVDGRNVWRNDLDATLAQIQQTVSALGMDRIQLAPSCSLMFSPHDLDLETELDAELHSWLAFARQKLDELAALKQAVDDGIEIVAEAFSASREAAKSRRESPRTHNLQVRKQLDAVDQSMLRRENEYKVRKSAQAEKLSLPLLPTTTIGSFPQTPEIRAHRSAKNKGSLPQDEYDVLMKMEIARTIRLQEDMGLDVLVHGEFERTDMVEYFGERLTGIAFTQHGWVQSYGSRGVRPPIIFGDVARPVPMTVEWSAYAQSLTSKPIKGMLTGPVTILEWSFVRDDQPRALTCRQIALAIREETLDLERAGIHIIQIDEPAFREGLPLRRTEQEAYLQWAIECFRLASSGVRDETQIHTHMCYAEFNDIIKAIGQMDADVISVEASRSKMELLDTFEQYKYPGDIGPGIYDIHSPNIPSQAEMEILIAKAAQVVPIERLWINPDCGLKTRQWDEVIPALKNMVNAAQTFRQQQDV